MPHLSPKALYLLTCVGTGGLEPANQHQFSSNDRQHGCEVRTGAWRSPGGRLCYHPLFTLLSSATGVNVESLSSPGVSY